MALFRNNRSKRSRPYCLRQQQDLEARRTLLTRARKGEGQAQADLMALYGVRVSSGSERSGLLAKKVPITFIKARSRVSHPLSR